jgi:hypothetical protein
MKRSASRPSRAGKTRLPLAIAGLTVLAAPSLAAPPPGLPGTMQRMDGPVREGGMVAFVDPASLAWQPFARWPGVEVRVLSEDPASGRLAVQARFPAGWRGGPLQATTQSIEIVMLEGGLGFGADTLGRYDFAFVPPGVAPPALGSAAGARAFLFFDPPAPDAAAVQRQRGRGAYVSRFDPARWQPASVARSAGATADLKVMHLKKDPFTSARTWYVRLEGGMKVPWEVHSMVEEGVLMEGRYRLAECLPGRTVIGEYGAEGYFWRPGGIPHSGPESGPPAGGATAIWLQRSPIALDVVFYGGCAAGTPQAPVAPAAQARP